MADLSDVENGMVGLIASTLIAGAYAPGAIATTTGGIPIKIYRGWPVAANLDADLIAGRAHVSVYADAAMARNTTRYQDQGTEPIEAVPTLTATVSGADVTFAGAAGLGQVAGVQIGGGVTRLAYAVRTVDADTPEGVALRMSYLIPGASASGPVLSIPTPLLVSARVVADQTSIREVRRQEQVLRIICWCVSPQQRDALAGTLDAQLSDVRRFAAPDGSSVRLVYAGTQVFDAPSKDRLWRRDLRYLTEYATTITDVLPEALAIGGNIEATTADYSVSWGAV